MSYFSPYIDKSGLHVPTYADILEDMIATMKTIYGDDIYLGNDSADYQFLSIFALKTADTLQAVKQAYNSRSPSTAIGAALDSIVKLNGISRKGAGYSTCQVILTGTPWTEVQNGSAKDQNGVVWNLPVSVVIGEDGTATVTATCAVSGAVAATPGDISIINTPTYGWKSITNTVSAVLGNDEETDAELRVRQTKSVANPSQTMLQGTLGAIIAVDNVARATVYENDTNLNTVDENYNPHGFPAHSVTCVVEGGADEDIAEAILYHKGVGCYTNGDTEITVTDENGYENKIRFYRPAYVPVYVKVTIKKYGGYLASIMASIQKAVYEYLASLEIGQTVSISMLTAIVMNCNASQTAPTFGVTSIKIGRKASSVDAADISMTYKEVAEAVYENTEVTEA